MARHPPLAERSFIIGSFGKTFHVTGWKIGYVAAPAALMASELGLVPISKIPIGAIAPVARST